MLNKIHISKIKATDVKKKRNRNKKIIQQFISCVTQTDADGHMQTVKCIILTHLDLNTDKQLNTASTHTRAESTAQHIKSYTALHSTVVSKVATVVG